MKKRVLSAIQPTGDLHIGNYFGAISNWLYLQNEYDCTYGVVDYHSMTMPYKAEVLRTNTWKMVQYLLACGIKQENLFIQSLVPEHTELAWILGCVTSFGNLSRMTQFKDKSNQLEEKESESFISSGLFNYPVLQAADILIYKADFVPIGQDQLQHLELTRDIAERFNFQFGKPYFELPKPLLTEFPKIMSTAEPTKKMSKSLGEKHYINLFADETKIRKQIQSAVTDTGAEEPGVMSAGVSNLFTILKACSATEAHESLMANYNAGTLKYSELKPAVADALVKVCNPIRERFLELDKDKKQIKEATKASSEAIRKVAQATMREVKELVGLPNTRN